MNRYRIFIQKLSWTENIIPEERNYFARNFIQSPKTEITDLIISESLSEIIFTREEVDANESKLYIESSNFSFKILDATNAGIYPMTISNYLGIYEYDELIRFIITLEDNYGNEIIKGILYKDGISYNNRKDNIIDLNVVGFENEFKNYYANKNLPEIGFSTLLNINLTGFQARNIRSVLEELFNIPIEMTADIINYYIARKPYVYKPHSKFFRELLNIRTGYESFRRDGINRIVYLNSICQPMGWVWFIYKDKLHIRNRYEQDYTQHTIDWESDIINHSIQNVGSQIGYDYIIINSGRFYSNGNLLSPAYATGQFQSLQGGRYAVYKSEIGYDNYLLPFYNLFLDGNTYNISYNNYTTIAQSFEQNYDFKRYRVYQPQPTITNESLTYSRNRTLLINPYVVSDTNSAGLDISLARTSGGYIDIGNGNFFVTNIALGNNDFRYSGNAAMSLFKYDSSIDKYITYDDYINLRYSDNFKKNFSQYSKFNEQILFEIEINSVIETPLKTFKIINYPYYNLLNSNFSLQKLSINLNNRTTKLTLLKDA